MCEPRSPKGCTMGGQQAVLSLKSRVFQCHDGGSALSVSANILYIQTVEPHLLQHERSTAELWLLSVCDAENVFMSLVLICC